MVQVTQAGRRHEEDDSSPDCVRDGEGDGSGSNPKAPKPELSHGRGYSTLLLWQGPDRTKGTEQGLLKSTPLPRLREGLPEPEGDGPRTV